jgi:hypothetical protein
LPPERCSRKSEASLPLAANSMDEHRQALQFNYTPHQLSLDASRPRYPLADSAGNAQAPSSIYSDHKGALANFTPQNFSLPTLPSQQVQKRPNKTALEVRKSQIRGHKFRRNRNPIVESENYQNYRSRQTRNNPKDVKWPDDLEDLFLDGKHLYICIFAIHVDTVQLFLTCQRWGNGSSALTASFMVVMS